MSRMQLPKDVIIVEKGKKSNNCQQQQKSNNYQRTNSISSKAISDSIPRT